MNNKYKIAVYAICKNEEKFVNRWFDSMSEADEIYVLDTGSTDNTVKKLEKLGVHVTKKTITPWRFDEARNSSLELLPEDIDICVCTDLDEVFVKGWRNELEKNWQPDTTRARYDYNWYIDDEGNPKINFYIDKIHKRKGYKWTHPVHEVLEYDGMENYTTIDTICLNHYPDREKSRANYLPLLELSVKESPNDDRNTHYLGREYMYYGRWNEAIDTLIRHLSLKTATWRDERCASMRFIARCYTNLKRYDEAKMWLEKAILEAPHLRDALVERAILANTLEEWEDVKKYCLRALDIRKHPKSYINEPFTFDGTVEDLLSLSYFKLGYKDEALYWIKEALKYKPNDKRLLSNKAIFEQFSNR